MAIFIIEFVLLGIEKKALCRVFNRFLAFPVTINYLLECLLRVNPVPEIDNIIDQFADPSIAPSPSTRERIELYLNHIKIVSERNCTVFFLYICTVLALNIGEMVSFMLILFPCLWKVVAWLFQSWVETRDPKKICLKIAHLTHDRIIKFIVHDRWEHLLWESGGIYEREEELEDFPR